MNDPRCEMGSEGCPNQGAGWWTLPGGKRIVVLCDDCKRGLKDQGVNVEDDGWIGFDPSEVTLAIDRRLIAMRAGYFDG